MFLADLPGAIVVPLANANPPPAIGPITQTVLPIGKWKIQTDGIVLLSATDGPLNEDVAQIIFPEIDIDKVNKISGMDISFVTSAKTDKEAMSLLRELGIPFKKK